jgi:hypothetical protein
VITRADADRSLGGSAGAYPSLGCFGSKGFLAPRELNIDLRWWESSASQSKEGGEKKC